MHEHMGNDFPNFESEEDLREWFDTADLAGYTLHEALDVVVAHHVELALDNAQTPGAGTAGATGTVSELHLVRG